MLQNLIKTGLVNRAQKLVIYGPNGIGKTTLAAQFPGPIFLDAEDGTTHQQLTRIQTPTEDSFFEALRVLGSEEHSFKTLVIDTIDVGERYVRERVLKRHRMKNIEDFGYGRGWTYLREEFDSFLGGCLDSFVRRGMHVVAIGHSTVKRVQPPGLSDAYDRFELKLDSVNSAKLKEWADALLFLSWDVRISENAEGRIRGVGGKERIVYTTHSAAYDAKNRLGLPEKLKCEFAALAPLLDCADAPQNRSETGATLKTAPLNTTISVQQQLADALADSDPEVLRLFLLNRKICPDGMLASVPDDYATKALEHLPKFKATVEQFAKEPF
jgi:AAA domain-containing protein